jgi:hypothetical protein
MSKRPYGSSGLGDVPRVDSAGTVTQHIKVNQRLPQSRSQNSTRPRNQRYGNYTSPQDVSIREAELIFSYKQPPTAENRQNEPFGFSSFSGIQKEPKDTQQEFEDKFRFVGVTKTSYVFNNNGQAETNSGMVATAIRGSETIRNTGPQDVIAGDRIMWKLNSVDPDKYVKERDASDRLTPEKALPVLERVDYSHTHQIAHDAMDKALNQGLPTVLNQVKETDALTQLSVALKQDSLAKLLLGLVPLIEKGIITVNKTPNKTLAEKPLQPSMEYSAEISQLSKLLGLARPNAGDKTLQDDVLRIQNYGLIRDKDSKDVFNIKNYVSYDPRDPNKTLSEELVRLQNGFAKDTIQAYAQAKNMVDEKVIGVAMMNGGRGKTFDICL